MAAISALAAGGPCYQQMASGQKSNYIACAIYYNMKKIEPLGYDEKRASELISGAGLDGLLLGAPENVYYATGCPTLPGTGNPILYALRNAVPSFAYISQEGKVTLFTWFGVTLGVEYSSELVTYADLGGAKDELQAFMQGKKKVGVDYGVPLHALQLIENSGSSAVDGDRLIISMRLIKSGREIQMLEKSAGITQDVLEGIGSRLKAGVTRSDVMKESRAMMMQYGATGVDHLTVAFGASNPEIMIDESLEREQLVTLDLGAVYEGYVSDIRRFYYSGERVPANDLKLFKTMAGIIDGLQDYVLPGRQFGQVYDEAARLYEKNGLSPLFATAGHSIGLVTEESHFSPGNEIELEKNMVVNLELYAPDKNGLMVGDEETYLITEKGARRITGIKREIRPLKL
ncbi:MAG: aminopeptidase P family protein [Nitrososphaerota archaeon]|nr:aminopeptidase P family protein [Nitrososphaerota archaeon]MDG6932616.1 aminopeptidase P family protein [Nitrososphaerota archaeon]MDG6944036.1 aminopeptidase P family protein [Nitrososphaerota archaeon]